MTHKYWEELINKFEDYYKENTQIIEDPQKQATEFLLNLYKYKYYQNIYLKDMNIL